MSWLESRGQLDFHCFYRITPATLQSGVPLEEIPGEGLCSAKDNQLCSHPDHLTPYCHTRRDGYSQEPSRGNSA